MRGDGESAEVPMLIEVCTIIAIGSAVWSSVSFYLSTKLAKSPEKSSRASICSVCENKVMKFTKQAGKIVCRNCTNVEA